MSNENKMKEIQKLVIHTPNIRLDNALKLSGAAQTGGHAKILVQDGTISVNGTVCTQRGKKLVVGDRFEADGKTFEVTNQ